MGHVGRELFSQWEERNVEEEIIWLLGRMEEARVEEEDLYAP